MESRKSKIYPPQSMDELGKDIMDYCKSEEATKEDINLIISELEEMKGMLEDWKANNPEDIQHKKAS